MNVTKLTAAALVIGSALLGMSTASAERVGTQYFYGYQGQFENGKWGIIDDLDFADVKSELDDEAVNADAKAQYIKDGRIQFDVQWTNKTLQKLYPDEWQNLVKGAADKQAKREAVKFLREQTCDAKMEIGYATTYGIDGNGFAAELDTHPCQSGSKVGTVRMRTFLPTIPGAEYVLYVKYQKRDYNFEKTGAPSEKKAFRDLIVRVDSQRHSLPLAAVEGEKLEEGFKKATIKFTAERYFTTVTLRDSGYPDSFGVLVRGIHVDEKPLTEYQQACIEAYPDNKKRQKLCLVPEQAPDTQNCNLHSDNISWHKGDHTSNAASRSTEENLLSPSSNQFLSLGAGGAATVSFKAYGQKAGCPIHGYTLAFKEHTNGNHDFTTYAEQGSVKIKLVGCDVEAQNGHKLIRGTENGGKLFKTNDQFTYDFAEGYEGCTLTAITIKDRTHKIKAKQDGYVHKSDGVDIYNLNLQ